jgi:hypothetical protein
MTKATPIIASVKTGWLRKNSTHRSPPDVEPPDPGDQDPLEDEPPPDQELEPCELDDRELELELCEPLYC